MIEMVLVHLKTHEPTLCVYAFEVLVPRNLGGLGSIKVDPDEAELVNVNVDRKKAILALIESVQVVVFRRFGELAIQTILPS